jgi:tripartite-type tricarboxylate transporter receptor subunit TctC
MPRLARLLRLIAALALASALAPPCGPAFAQAPVDALAPLDGKTIRFIIGTGPGEGTDLYSRALIDAMQPLIPTTTILAQNVAGGGGTLALVEAQSAGGGAIVLASVNASPIYSQLRGSDLSVVDLNRFHWIGSIASNQRVAVIRTSLGVANVEELIALGREIIAPTPSATSPSNVETTLLGAITGLNLQIVVGVSEELRDAMLLAGDADLAVNSFYTMQPLIESGQLMPIVRLGSTGHPPELEALPTVADIALPGTPPALGEMMDTLDRLGRLVLSPPDTDQATVDALRLVMERAMDSPDLAATLVRQSLQLAPTTGAEVERRVTDLLGDPAMVELFRAYFECGKREAEGPSVDCVAQ